MRLCMMLMLGTFSCQTLSEPTLLQCNTTEIDSPLKWQTPHPNRYDIEFIVDAESKEVLRANGYSKNMPYDLFEANWQFTDTNIHILVSTKPKEIMDTKVFRRELTETLINRFTLEYFMHQSVNYEGEDTELVKKLTSADDKSVYRGQCKVMNKKLSSRKFLNRHYFPRNLVVRYTN